MFHTDLKAMALPLWHREGKNDRALGKEKIYLNRRTRTQLFGL